MKIANELRSNETFVLKFWQPLSYSNIFDSYKSRKFDLNVFSYVNVWKNLEMPLKVFL